MHYALMEAPALMFFCQKIKKMQELPQGITRTVHDQNQEKLKEEKMHHSALRIPHSALNNVLLSKRMR